MENASKALLMAGGILIAILVIGALVLMFNQLSAYQNANDTNIKTSQLAKFNSEFEKYNDDNGISGADLISLINKVIDYNTMSTKVGKSNYIDYDVKMSITVKGLNKFQERYGYTPTSSILGPGESKTLDSENLEYNALYKLVNYYNGKTQQEINALKKAYVLYDGSKECEEKIKSKLLEMDSNKYKYWTLSGTISPTKNEIQNYKEYTEFKASTFVPYNNVIYNKNGQIQKLFFTYK